MNTDGSGHTVLKHFTSFDYPLGPLVLSGSTLYGTTESGGAINYGSVFKVETNGSGYTLLRSFFSEGAVPRAGPLLLNDKLYGTTSVGGEFGYGTVFNLNTNGSGLNILKSFSATDGIKPHSSLVWSRGALYGTTSTDTSVGGGGVFRMFLAPAMNLSKTGSQFTINWSAAAGLTFQLQYTTSLFQTNWINHGAPILATNSSVTVSNTGRRNNAILPRARTVKLSSSFGDGISRWAH